MGKYLIVDMEISKVIDSYESEYDAWDFIGEAEHNYNQQYPALSYEDVDRIIRARYRIYSAI